MANIILSVNGWDLLIWAGEPRQFDTLPPQLVEYPGSGGSKIYAIIETGGKQYKVSPGQTIDVERLDIAEGDTVEMERVLLIADGDRLTVGKPIIKGAKVTVTSKGEGKGKKIIVFKYKSKVRYSKKTGHRQLYTRLAIEKISEPEAAQDKPLKKVRRPKKEVAENGT